MGCKMSTTDSVKKLQPHWWHKTLAGGAGGFALALLIVGFFAWYGPGGIRAADKVQFNMWMITPLWMLIFSLTYLFRTGWRSLLFMLVVNTVGWSVFLMLRGDLPA